MTRLLALSLLLVTLLACRREQAPPEPPAAAAPGTAVPCAAQQLTQIDSRKPLPLLPRMALHQKQNMRDHLVAVQQIVAGLASNDFSTIEGAAAKLGMSEPR